MDKHEKPLSWSGILPPVPPTVGEKVTIADVVQTYQAVERLISATPANQPDKEVDWEKVMLTDEEISRVYTISFRKPTIEDLVKYRDIAKAQLAKVMAALGVFG